MKLYSGFTEQFYEFLSVEHEEHIDLMYEQLLVYDDVEHTISAMRQVYIQDKPKV